jgi:hypothetical protein
VSAPRPWMKFHPRDWQADEGLAFCSIGARGLWVELMCIMHQTQPYGHLLVKGKQPTDKQLSILLRVPLIDLTKLMEELEENEVFSRTNDGTIFSRRMVRDEGVHEQAARYGHKGQLVKARKEKANKGPSRVASRPPSSTPSSLESESERESENPPVVPQGTKTRIPDDWEPLEFGRDTQSRRIVDGWDEQRLASEAEAFRAHHRTANSRYSDWQATWSTWVLNTEKFERPKPRAAAPRSHIDIVLEEYADRPPQPKERASANQ